jgi:hypothetical protein
VIKGIQDREKRAAYIIMNIFKRVVQRKTHTKKLEIYAAIFRFSKAFSLLLGAQSGDNKLT